MGNKGKGNYSSSSHNNGGKQLTNSKQESQKGAAAGVGEGGGKQRDNDKGGHGGSKHCKQHQRKKKDYKSIDYGSLEEVEFSDKINKSDFDVSLITGDGNCFFRALSVFLFGNETRHMEVRTGIMDFVESHEEDLSLFVEDDEPFADYVARMRSLGEWGGHIELYAASIRFNIIILVVPVGGPFYIVNANDRGPLTKKDQNGDEPKAPVRYAALSFHDECHYNVLRPRSNIVSSIRLLNAVGADSSSSLSSSSMNSGGGGGGGGSKGAAVDSLTETTRMVPWIAQNIVQVALKRFNNNVLETVEYLINCHDFDELLEYDKDVVDDTTEVTATDAATDVEKESVKADSSADSSADNKKPKWVKKPKALSKKDQRKLERTKASIATAISSGDQVKTDSLFSGSTAGTTTSNNGNGKTADELLGLKVGGIFI